MAALNHPHPGDIIRFEVIEPLGLSIDAAAAKLAISPADLVPILDGQAPITDELAQGLERAGWSTARLWMALQSEYNARVGAADA